MEFITELTIGAQLGSGGFGRVFAATHPVHGRLAIKYLAQRPGETAADWSARSRELLAEGQRLKSAAHDNVIKVIDVVRYGPNDQLNLVTELCDGGCLEKEFQKGPMSLGAVKKVLTDVGRGLAHIHSCGMIHRDIKPGNILKDGKVYKIGDFGLVSDKLILNYASGRGYRDHLAPEVYRNNVTSVRSDIWALGMTAYRLLHGAAYYQEHLFPNSGNIPTLIKGGKFAQQLPWLAHIPDSWRRFLRCALHYDAHSRHASCHEMSQALGRLPAEPNWHCQYKAGAADWTLKEDARTVYVGWREHSPRKHEWWAERSGGTKRTLSIGGKRGVLVSPSEAQDGLEKLFEKIAR
jgi:serine/threonine protein kinase